MDDYKTGHRERLRNRVEDTGMDIMRSHEILEFILCHAVPRVDMNETARILIKRFGSLKNVLEAPSEELLAVRGVGKSVVEWLGIVREMVDAYDSIDPSDHKKIMRYTDALEYVVDLKKKIQPPQSIVLYIDFNRRIMMKEIICSSLSWVQPEFTRRIIRQSIALQARSIILVLFPGNTPFEYEESDIQNLLDFSRSLHAIQTELLDCIIVEESSVKSLNACGVMDIIRNESKNRSLHEEYTLE